MKPTLAWLSLALVAACATVRPGVRTEQLRAAPEQVEVDGREFSLEVSLWRDFMPIAPPGGHPLTTVAKVTVQDMMPMPDDLQMDRVWVINGDEKWEAPLTGNEPSGTTGRLERMAAGGPKWTTGTKVDVVVRLAKGKQTWLLRKAGQEIRRTD